MKQPQDSVLETVRKLSKETGMGLLFCYKALKKFDFDSRHAAAYLKSDQFRSSIYQK